MIEQVHMHDVLGSKMAAIREVRQKRMLLDKCQRKMALSALDGDDMKIHAAASERLVDDINALCWRIGL